jgi:hypothetical protein
MPQVGNYKNECDTCISVVMFLCVSVTISDIKLKEFCCNIPILRLFCLSEIEMFHKEFVLNYL